MKITFRMWGKLEGKGSVRLYETDTAIKKEANDFALSALQRKLPIPYNLDILTGKVRAKIKSKDASINSRDFGTIKANCFLMEVFNPRNDVVNILLSFHPTDPEKKSQYQTPMILKPGYNYFQIPVEEISKFCDLSEEFLVQLQPQPDTPGLVLYFGIIDFAHDSDLANSAAISENEIGTTKPETKIKCVVWDLDNTLWKGTLIEDGEDNVVINEDAVALIKDLDQRGIINSVASKNNAEDALTVLNKYGLEEFFLYPDISWGPKSQAIRRIAHRLNIGIDTFAFIDDQPFERAEVSETHKDVACYDATEVSTLLGLARFDVPITEDTKKRRHLYKNQIEREEAMGSSDDDYETFLKSCKLKLVVEPLTEKSIARVYELAQRTNQMNFTGNRYSRKALREIMRNSNLDTYVLGCNDRFGNYGIIGFSIIRKSDNTMQDLMFSCRIQSKRVDHAFLTHVVTKYHKRDKLSFSIAYQQSAKNTPSAQIFSDMGFVKVGEQGSVSKLSYPENISLPENNIVEVIST
ncbi:MAG: HAD-IIIC family phosphatase [Sneathiella sp.]